MPVAREMIRMLIKVGVSFAAIITVGVGLFLLYQFTLAGRKVDFAALNFNPSLCGAEGQPPEPQDLIYAAQLQQHQNELGLTAGNDPADTIYTVQAGQSALDIANDLEVQGFIRNADLFVTFLKCRHVSERIQAGDHILRRNMTMDQVAQGLQRSFQRGATVSIRPGWRAEEVADSLAQAGLLSFDKAKFISLIKAGGFDYPFLQDRPKTASKTVEGFLLPDTYNVLLDWNEKQLADRFLKAFNDKYSKQLQQQAAAQKLTIYELVTVASIVEREAVVGSERPIIASVYLNRVRRKMTLNADPTVQYAMGYQAATKQWWKTPVTLEEYAKVDSPYNTYLYAGLPPGPICEPSLASIQATLNPATTDYFYFVAVGDGTHAFAKTLEEQNQNLQKYGYTVPVVPTKKP